MKDPSKTAEEKFKESAEGDLLQDIDPSQEIEFSEDLSIFETPYYQTFLRYINFEKNLEIMQDNEPPRPRNRDSGADAEELIQIVESSQ